MSADRFFSSRLFPERFMSAFSHTVALPLPSITAVMVPPFVPYRAALNETFDGMKTTPSSGVSVNVTVLPSTGEDGRELPVSLAIFVCTCPLLVVPFHVVPPFLLTVSSDPYETVLPVKPTVIVSGLKTGSASTSVYVMFPVTFISCPPALLAVPCTVMSDTQRYLPDASLPWSLYHG